MQTKIYHQLIITSLMIVLLGSCAIQLPIPLKTSTYLDFTKYPDFYITQSQSLDFKYKPIGLITSTVISGYKRKQTEAENMVVNDQKYFAVNSTMDHDFIGMTAKDAVDLIYEKAKAMGANGIIGIKIDYIPSGTPGFSTYGFTASGMAIEIPNK
jgi:hypothetical protein